MTLLSRTLALWATMMWTAAAWAQVTFRTLLGQDLGTTSGVRPGKAVDVPSPFTGPALVEIQGEGWVWRGTLVVK